MADIFKPYFNYFYLMGINVFPKTVKVGFIFKTMHVISKIFIIIIAFSVLTLICTPNYNKELEFYDSWYCAQELVWMTANVLTFLGLKSRQTILQNLFSHLQDLSAFSKTKDNKLRICSLIIQTVPPLMLLVIMIPISEKSLKLYKSLSMAVEISPDLQIYQFGLVLLLSFAAIRLATIFWTFWNAYFFLSFIGIGCVLIIQMQLKQLLKMTDTQINASQESILAIAKSQMRANFMFKMIDSSFSPILLISTLSTIVSLTMLGLPLILDKDPKIEFNFYYEFFGIFSTMVILLMVVISSCQIYIMVSMII